MSTYNPEQTRYLKQIANATRTLATFAWLYVLYHIFTNVYVLAFIAALFSE